MSLKTAVGILVVVVLIIVGFIVLRGPAEAPGDQEIMTEVSAPTTAPAPGEETTSAPAPTAPTAPETPQQGAGPQSQTYIVTYTESGYTPAVLTVKAGDTVTWRNESSRDMWTASAIHPTHKVYPGSDIQLCGTAQAAGIFDACRGVSAGGSWSFTFNEKGTWRYHNHFQSSHTGTVVVE